MTDKSTTQISAIITRKDVTEPPGGIIHKTVMDHFASAKFGEYAAFRKLDEQLLQDVSGELTRYLRTENVKTICGFSEIVAAVCTDAKGYSVTDDNDSNVIIFTIQIYDD